MSTPPNAGQDQAELETTALRVSVVVGAGCAALAVVWGLLSGSRVVMLDGASAVISLALSTVAYWAALAARRPDTRLFPYGKQTFIPAAVGMQGVAWFALSAYAVTDALLLIIDGGDAVASGSVIVYAFVVTIVCAGTTRWLRRRQDNSDLVHAEAIGWRVSTLLSTAILVGFTLVALLPEGPVKDQARLYIDPTLVIIVSLIALPAPLSMLRTMTRELFDMSPTPEIADPVTETTRAVLVRHGLPDPFIRMTKTGGRLYLEVDHLVPPGTWTADQVDVVRAEVMAAVHTDAYTTWLNLDISTNPSWWEG